MVSIWSADSALEKRESLKHNIKVDVVIIGAGMAGILIGQSLKEKGLKVIVLEADKVGSGVTKNTTAKITSLHSLIYDKLIKETSEEIAEQYANANEKAVKLFKKIIEEKKIDCNFKEASAYVYSKDNEEVIEAEVDAAKKLGINASMVKDNPFPFSIEAMVRFENQAHFNPLQFIQAIQKQLTIYENTKVLSIEDHVVITDKGKVAAKSIVMATHFPFINAPGYYFARMYQQRSYVIALENAQKIDGMYIDADENGYSFRPYKDMLLFGGAGHRTGKSEYSKCFTPQRFHASASTKNLVVDGIETVSGLFSQIFASAKIEIQEIPREHAGIVDYKGMKVGVYKDIEGKVFLVTTKCPHLGCKLTWNLDELSWDCPCHGSRFDYKGRLIGNPATKGIGIKE